MVSIILPVRNQASSVRACVDSLIDSDYPRKEIIVVEGGSEDETRAILDRYEGRIMVLDEPPLPEGWVGKNWACHEGFRASTGDLLLFTDGDTVHRKDLLRRAVTYMLKEDLDLLTLTPRMKVESFWEAAILPFMIFLIGLLNRGAWVNRPDKPWAVGNGQFLLFRREVYVSLDGHKAVKERVDEDYRLARLAKGEGYRLRLGDAREAMEVRMYPSLKEIWSGWVKNVFPGLDFSVGRVARNVISLFVGFVLPFILLGIGLLDLMSRGPTLLLITGAFLSAMLWARSAVAYGYLSRKPHYALLTPVAALIIIAILVDSTRRYTRHGGVSWKGRMYGIPQK